MNILVATPSFPALDMGVYDGRFVLSEAIAYARAGAKVRVLTPHFPGAKEVEEAYRNVMVFRFPYFLPRSYQRLRRPGIPIYKRKTLASACQVPSLGLLFTLAILKHAPWADIIHAQWTVTALLALPTKWLYNRKLVVTARGTDLRNVPRRLNQFIHHKVDAAIDCFGLQPLNEWYKRTFSGRFLTLPLIVHIDPCDKMPEDMKDRIKGDDETFKILYVGRFDEFKIEYNKLPIFDLVKAAAILKGKGSHFHIFYIGGGSRAIEEKLFRLITTLGLTDRVFLLGAKANPTDYIQFADLGVGGIAFNAVSQEFTVLGKPQLLMGVPDNINTPWKDRRNAIFVRPNSVDDLVTRLQWCLENRDRLRRIGEAARKDMAEYMVDSSQGGNIYLESFRKILDKSPTRLEG